MNSPKQDFKLLIFFNRSINHLYNREVINLHKGGLLCLYQSILRMKKQQMKL